MPGRIVVGDAAHRAARSEPGGSRRSSELCAPRGVPGRPPRGSRGRLRRQGEHPRGAARALAHGDPRAVGLRLPARRLRRAAGVERPRRPDAVQRHHRASAARHAHRAPDHRHLPRPPAPRARRGREHLQAQVRPSRPNQPCVEAGTERCFITSQNHGYAVDADVAARRLGPLVHQRQRRLERGHAPPLAALLQRAVPSRGRARPGRLRGPVRPLRGHGCLEGHARRRCCSSAAARSRSARPASSTTRAPGDQGAARGGHLHGPRQPEHRHHPDLDDARRPGLFPAGDPGLRRAGDRARAARRDRCSASAARPRSTAASSSTRRGVLERSACACSGTPIRSHRGHRGPRSSSADGSPRSASKCRAAPRRTRLEEARSRWQRDRLSGHAARRLTRSAARARHRAHDEAELRQRARTRARRSSPQVLVEECLRRLEGDRVRGRARRARQLHHRLQHGELRPDGHPHGRVASSSRRSQTLDDARVPAAARRSRSRPCATSASSASATSSTRSTRTRATTA